jgi:hypothetical protein
VVTREKYDCKDCGARIEKTWFKSRHVPVRIFEECDSDKCEGKLKTYTLINSLYGVSQPEPRITAVEYALQEGLCPECCEDEATHWGLCAGCYWKQEEQKEDWFSTWDRDIEEE